MAYGLHYIRQFAANHFDPKYIRSEANFIAAVRHAVTFGGIKISEISRGIGSDTDEVQQWVLDDIHKSAKQHPTKETREKTLLFLRDALQKRAEQILCGIERPPR